MSKKYFTYEAKVKLKIELTPTGAKLCYAKTMLLPPPVMRAMWHDRREQVTEAGNNAQLLAFVQGIVSSILVAEDQGWRQRAQYRQYVIDEVDRALSKATGVQDDVYRDYDN